MSFWISGTLAVVSAYGAYSANQAGNESADAASANATRRYAISAGISKNQMEEQNQIAMEKMTDIARSFLKAKGTARAIQAETMTAGNIERVKASDLRTKESETKGKVAQEVNTNIINIAQGMIAEKIDTEALVAQAIASKKTGLAAVTDIALAGAGGAMTGASLASSYSSYNSKKPAGGL